MHYLLKKALITLYIQPLKLFHINIPPVPSTCGIITAPDDPLKILMIELTYLPGLSLPGGYLNPGETLEEGLAREIREETSLKVTGWKYFGSFSTYKSIFHTICSLFEVTEYSGNITSSKEGKPIWVTIDEAIERCAYHDVKDALIAYRKQQSNL